MIPAGPTPADPFLQSILGRNPKLEGLIADLTAALNQSRIQTAEFLFQVLTNDLFCAATSAVLTLACLRVCHELGFHQFIHGLAAHLSHSKPVLAHKAFLAFLKDPKLTEHLALEVDAIEKKLTGQFPDAQTMDANHKIGQGLTAFPRIGPKPAAIPLYVFRREDSQRFLFDTWPTLNPLLDEIRALVALENQVWQPGFLAPLPQELPISTEEFCTPFPFLVESPLLNTALSFPDIAAEMLADAAELTEDAAKGGL